MPNSDLQERLNHIGTATEDLEEEDQQPVSPAPAAAADQGSAAAAASVTPLQLQQSPSEGQPGWSPGDMEVVFQVCACVGSGGGGDGGPQG